MLPLASTSPRCDIQELSDAKKISAPRYGALLERGKWRIVVVENNARKSHFFLSEKEALRRKADLAKEVALLPLRKLADRLAEWEASRVRNGTCKPQTAREHAVRMRLFLASFLERDITKRPFPVSRDHKGLPI